jgi:hypothetical protein
MPTIRSIVRDAAREDNRLSSLVVGIVKKPALPQERNRDRWVMFISKKHLPRDVLERGGIAGASVGVDGLAGRHSPAPRPRRRPGQVHRHSAWRDDGQVDAGRRGDDVRLSRILQPLEAFRDRVCVVSNLAHAPVAPWAVRTMGGGEPVRAAAVFLSGAHPVKKIEAHVGATVDQLLPSRWTGHFCPRSSCPWNR